MTALAAGVPQLVLPNGADRHASADAVAAHGAGLSAAPEDLDVELLAELMANPRLRARAGEVRDEIAAMPSPAAVVPRLVALAR